MKISKRQEFQQITVNHSSDLALQKSAAKPYSFLIIDTTLASHNPLRFRKNIFLEKM